MAGGTIPPHRDRAGFGRATTRVALWFDFIRMARMATQKQDDSLLEAERTRTKPPPLYKVLLLNDDFTPMDFVIVVLQKFFGMDRERATRVMLQVHREGMGVCGVFPKDVAATKVEQVVSFARQHQHPLACVMEEN
jgi:ATP-dependent Clp protease adaptor protein ClpS